MGYLDEPRLQHKDPLRVNEHSVVHCLCNQCACLPHLIFDLLECSDTANDNVAGILVVKIPCILFASLHLVVDGYGGVLED